MLIKRSNLHVFIKLKIKVCLGILCALTDIHMLVVIDSTLILLKQFGFLSYKKETIRHIFTNYLAQKFIIHLLYSFTSAA